MLALFNFFKEAGYEIISLDYNKKFDATHTEDILNWNYQQYPQGYFDVIWGSPDCTSWSLATGGKYRTKASIYGLGNKFQEGANLGTNMVLKVIDIIIILDQVFGCILRFLLRYLIYSCHLHRLSLYSYYYLKPCYKYLHDSDVKY